MEVDEKVWTGWGIGVRRGSWIFSSLECFGTRDMFGLSRSGSRSPRKRKEVPDWERLSDSEGRGVTVGQDLDCNVVKVRTRSPQTFLFLNCTEVDTGRLYLTWSVGN